MAKYIMSSFFPIRNKNSNTKKERKKHGEGLSGIKPRRNQRDLEGSIPYWKLLLNLFMGWYLNINNVV